MTACDKSHDCRCNGMTDKRTQTLRSRAALHKWRQRAWRHPGNKNQFWASSDTFLPVTWVQFGLSIRALLPASRAKSACCTPSDVGVLSCGRPPCCWCLPRKVSHDETTSMYFQVAGRKLCVTHNRPKVFRLWWADRAGVYGGTVPPIHEYAGQPPHQSRV